MKKELDELHDIFDTVFNGVNESQRIVGSGLSFFYKIRAEVKKDDDGEDISVYFCDISLREMGHGERQLQEFSYVKPKDLDTFKMKYQVILSVMVSMIESGLIHWNELGKALNTDIDLQDKAKTIIHNG